MLGTKVAATTRRRIRLRRREQAARPAGRTRRGARTPESAYQQAERERELLRQLVNDMVRDIHELSEQADELSVFKPLSVERQRYIVDAMTRAMGQIVEELTGQWAKE